MAPAGTRGRRRSVNRRSDTVIGRAGEEEILLVHFDVDKIREFQRAEFWRVDYRHHDHEITLTYNACALKADSPIGYGNASPGPGFRPRASRGCIVWYLMWTLPPDGDIKEEWALAAVLRRVSNSAKRRSAEKKGSMARSLASNEKGDPYA